MLYVAGTKSLGDAVDDLKIPLRQTRNTARYKAAEDALFSSGPIHTVVGHSLGGTVALELESKFPHLRSRTYGAPVASFSSAAGERYRHSGDPVSMFDFGALSSFYAGNPHSSSGF